MERVNRIYRHADYQRELVFIAEAEKNRAYCVHDMQHFLDVARISMIINAGQGYGFEKEVLYAAALLHDIGRGQEYRDGIPHDAASARLAEKILPECGYTEEETIYICEAIKGHRLSTDGTKVRTLLGDVLHKADHLSRSCYCCPEENTCYWPSDKKNMEIRM